METNTQKEPLEYRMYGLVNYQFSASIHAGIQFGHAVVDYGLKHFTDEDYQEWANYYKTMIILNGGTTNNNQYALGTLNIHYQTLLDNGIKCMPFHEPDLGDQLTAVCFLVDERVFNKTKYPDYIALTSEDEQELKDNDYKRIDWEESIGGEQNVFLRDFLKNFRLA